MGYKLTITDQEGKTTEYDCTSWRYSGNFIVVVWKKDRLTTEIVIELCYVWKVCSELIVEE